MGLLILHLLQLWLVTLRLPGTPTLCSFDSIRLDELVAVSQAAGRPGEAGDD
jgi:hypothetical protein